MIVVFQNRKWCLPHDCIAAVKTVIDVFRSQRATAPIRWNHFRGVAGDAWFQFSWRWWHFFACSAKKKQKKKKKTVVRFSKFFFISHACFSRVQISFVVGLTFSLSPSCGSYVIYVTNYPIDLFQIESIYFNEMSFCPWILEMHVLHKLLLEMVYRYIASNFLVYNNCFDFFAFSPLHTRGVMEYFHNTSSVWLNKSTICDVCFWYT